MKQLLSLATLGVALIVAIFTTMPHAAAETDDRVLRGRVLDLRNAVERCEQRIASGKIDECTVTLKWSNREVSMSDALDIADELEPVPGVWSEWGEFSQITSLAAACRQTYHCHPSGSVLRGPNTSLVVTPAVSVWGACSAAGGNDPGECNSCISSPPETSCTWHLER
jgi:hypothetical protein